MNLKLKHIKPKHLLPYALAIATCTTICFGLCKFVTDKEISSNIAITETIASSMLMSEKYIDNNLKSANSALNIYLQNNPFPSSEKLNILAKQFSVDGYNIWNKEGERIYKSSEGRPVSPKDKKSFNLLESRPIFFEKTLKSEVEVDKISSLAFHNSISANGTITGGIKFAIQWMPSKQVFLNSYLKVPSVVELLKNVMSKHSSIENIKLTSPVGTVILNTYNKIPLKQENDYKCIVEEYSEEPIVKNARKIIVVLPFGGLQDSETYVKDSKHKFTRGQANDKGQYFYVMNVTFDKTSLNHQLIVIVILSIIFTFAVCSTIYLIQAYSFAKDNLVELCNTRMGEIRRYVTKITKDEMRTKNMNKDLPKELLEIFDKAFDKFSEK